MRGTVINGFWWVFLQLDMFFTPSIYRVDMFRRHLSSGEVLHIYAACLECGSFFGTGRDVQVQETVLLLPSTCVWMDDVLPWPAWRLSDSFLGAGEGGGGQRILCDVVKRNNFHAWSDAQPPVCTDRSRLAGIRQIKLHSARMVIKMVPKRMTKDRIMGGVNLFIGNQVFPHWSFRLERLRRTQ